MKEKFQYKIEKELLYSKEAEKEVEAAAKLQTNAKAASTCRGEMGEETELQVLFVVS